VDSGVQCIGILYQVDGVPRVLVGKEAIYLAFNGCLFKSTLERKVCESG
jgi:hypothetical protein